MKSGKAVEDSIVEEEEDEEDWDEAVHDVILSRLKDAGLFYTRVTDNGLNIFLSHMENQTVSVWKVGMIILL